MKLHTRILLYLTGLVILSFGVVLNTKTGLGVSPINSVPYSISTITGLSLGTMTVIMYSVYVVLESILLGKDFKPVVLLQLPCGMVFGRFTDMFVSMITIKAESMAMRLALLAMAIFCTALGVVITIRMDIVPMAPDGLTQVLGMRLKKDFGFAKNLFDFVSVIATLAIGLIFGGRVIGIGLGTLIAVVGIGRTIRLINGVINSVKRRREQTEREQTEQPQASDTGCLDGES